MITNTFKHSSQSEHQSHTWTEDLLCWLLILLFTYAAVSKLLDYNAFHSELRKSPLLVSFAGLVAIGVPALELIISLALVFEFSRTVGLYGSFFLLTVFSGYIIAITQFSVFIPCSCGGILESMNWNEHLFFNVGFALATVLTLYLRQTAPR